MHAMIPGQPPQEVLSYYVHGNPFIHRDGRPSEYTLGDMRTAYATRLAVSNQYQRHKPETRPNHPPYTPTLYSPVPNQAQAPLVFQPQVAPHSFHPGYFPGHHMTHTFHDPNHFITPHVPPMYYPTQQYTAEARTPPTPALTEDQRSAATSPDRLEQYGHQPNDPAWMVHAALTHSANTRTWQPPHVNLALDYEEYQEPMYMVPKPGVGPKGHILGGLNVQVPRYSQTPQLAPGADRYAVWENNGDNTTQPSSYAAAQIFASTGHVSNSDFVPRARSRGVGPGGHVLGGGSKERNLGSGAPDVLYDTSRGQPSHAFSAPRARDAPLRSAAGPVSTGPEITVTSASTTMQAPQVVRTRPRALSRISSMNLRNELDTVVEEEEPTPPPRMLADPVKRAHSFPICEDDDNEDASTDSAASEVSIETMSDAVQPHTPKDDEYDTVAPFVVLSAPSPSAEDVRYYYERNTVVSTSHKDNNLVVNIPKPLGVRDAKPLSRKAQRRVARR